MKRLLVLTMMSIPIAAPAFGYEADEKALIAKLGESKHSLLEAIAQAEKQDGPAISAKFELDHDKLMLSVYTAKQGDEHDAEHNTLMELAGEASALQWQPKTEVFNDKAHIARSAMQLTLMQMTKLRLGDIVKKAAAIQKGTVYSAIPDIKSGKAVVDVRVATAGGKSIQLILDAQTGVAVN